MTFRTTPSFNVTKRVGPRKVVDSMMTDKTRAIDGEFSKTQPQEVVTEHEYVITGSPIPKSPTATPCTRVDFELDSQLTPMSIPSRLALNNIERKVSTLSADSLRYVDGSRQLSNGSYRSGRTISTQYASPSGTRVHTRTVSAHYPETPSVRVASPSVAPASGVYPYLRSTTRVLKLHNNDRSRLANAVYAGISNGEAVYKVYDTFEEATGALSDLTNPVSTDTNTTQTSYMLVTEATLLADWTVEEEDPTNRERGLKVHGLNDATSETKNSKKRTSRSGVSTGRDAMLKAAENRRNREHKAREMQIARSGQNSSCSYCEYSESAKTETDKIDECSSSD